MDALAQLNQSLAGRYAIDREIGRGGMATVYLARDVRHSRRVALKVLNPELGAVLGVERFLAEIQVTANLQHPNLLPLFDSGEAEGLLFYVMPYIEGESLRATLTREKQLPLDQALGIATAVASALDYAHRHGVIHRDLKPENILLHEGQPMVADFGIALAVSNAGGSRITQTGLSLGTPHYMSPEQATGDRTIDGRTDVYSLGAVTYEMLTGEPPHSGTTAQAVIAKVLTDKPRSIRLSRDTVPAHVEHAVERALAKLPADRFAGAREFADALTGRTVVAESSASRERLAAAPLGRVARLAPWGLTLLASAAAVWAFLALRADTVSSDVVRFTVDIPESQAIVLVGNFGTPLGISPDARTIVYSGRSQTGRQLYARPLDALEARPIPGGQGGRNPVFSPDGRWIAFLGDNQLRVIPAQGGPPVVLATAGTGVGPQGTSGFTWLNNEDLLVAERSLVRISRLDRTPKQVTEPTTSESPGFPIVVPGEDYVIARVTSAGNLASGRLATVRLSDGKVTAFPVEAFAPLAIAGNMLLFARNDGSLMQVGFDRKRGVPTGSAFPLGDTVLTSLTAGAAMSISANGALLYAAGNNANTVVTVDSTGGARRTLLAEPKQYFHPRLSPDGRKLALEISESGQRELWVLDIASSTLTRVTNRGTSDRPEWTPDGERLVFPMLDSGVSRIAWQPADGSADASILFSPDNPVREATVTPDGKRLVYRVDHPTRQRDIWMLPLDGGKREPQAIFTTSADELMPRVSPDGKWLAYMSNESGRHEVYVRPFPGGGARLQVSTGGGLEPLWGRDSRHLFYRNGKELVRVTLTGERALAVQSRQPMFDDRFATDIYHPNYDVTRDGRHFVMLQPVEGDLRVVLVLNWLRELEKREAAR